MVLVDRGSDEYGPASVDNLIVSLRAYLTRAPTKARKSKGEETRPASRWSETISSEDSAQRLGPRLRLRNPNEA
jgi:hypothetical protein